MHTFNAKNGTTFHYNPDMSGEVHLRHSPDLEKGQFEEEFIVDGSDLKDFLIHVVLLPQVERHIDDVDNLEDAIRLCEAIHKNV